MYVLSLTNRVIGTFSMVLQQLVEVGQVSVSDCLLDDNNVAMKVGRNAFSLLVKIKSENNCVKL